MVQMMLLSRKKNPLLSQLPLEPKQLLELLLLAKKQLLQEKPPQLQSRPLPPPLRQQLLVLKLQVKLRLKSK